jgi:hypothetical protein
MSFQAGPQGSDLLETIRNIAISVALAILGIGVGVMSMTPPDYNIARVATIGFGISITIACLLWLSTTPNPLWGKGLVGGLTAILVFVGCPLTYKWIYSKERSHPSDVGILVPQRSLITHGTIHHNIRLQIGQSGVVLDKSWGLDDLIKVWGVDQFTIEIINDHLKVSTKIRNDLGNLIAELQQNEWKVAPPPTTWDRNYTNDALEVRDEKGRIVLQIRVLENIVQTQGAWWVDLGVNGRRRMIIKENPPDQHHHGAQIIFVEPGNEWPEIEPIFRYPSEVHLGELR